MYIRYKRNPVYIIQAVNNKTEMNVSGSKRTRYMECITMKITEDIIYVGVNDHDVDLFEGQYIVPNGMAYNSYVIRDEKIAVMDTVDGRFAEEWLANIEKALDGAPMVHWPEVMVTYDSSDKVLFSADGFGKFGALDVEEDWDCEARRYYIGIVGKYGAQVQNLLKVAATLDIQIICPLHGPVLTENLGHYIEKYNIWSSYGVESEGVMIAYASVYGNTKKAAELLAEKLQEKGCPKVVVCDLAREDMAEAVEDAFRYGKLVLASVTYNADVFPFMKIFIEHLTERNYQKRTLGLIENGSWAPTAARVMTGMFEKSKDITWLEHSVKIMSSLSEENEKELDAMAEELCK